MRLIKLLLTAYLVFPSFSVIAATGDILFQNCVGTCTTGGNWTGDHISVVTSGCQTDECYQVVFEGSSFSPQAAATGISGHDEITVTYWTKFNKSSIDAANTKAFRPYTGSSYYIGATIEPWTSYDIYVGHYTTAMTVHITDAVTDIRATESDNTCWTIVEGETYSCPERFAVDFTVNGQSGHPANTWVHTRFWIKLPSTISSADGEMAIWINDVLILTVDDMDIDDAVSTTFSGLDWFPSEDAGENYTKWNDDIIIYEGYVPPSSTDVQKKTYNAISPSIVYDSDAPALILSH